MRVLITTDVVGGVWQFTHELAAGLLREGASVALASFGGTAWGDQRRQCEALSRRYGNAFVYESASTPLEWMPENERAYHDGARLLMEMAQDVGAEILHSNQFCFGALPIDIPKVVTAHSDVLSWAEACRGQPLEDSRWLRQYCSLVAEGLKGASAVIAPTRWMLSALGRNFAVPARCEVIPNGRSIGEGGHPTRHLRAVTAGRLWDEAKDIGMLGAVSSPIPLYAAGKTEQGAERGPQLPRGVTLLGRMREEELHQFFRESAIYVCTSRYEPFGLAPLEAALCGCAVLARDVVSLREVWLDGALYFSDSRTLTALLHDMIMNPELLDAARRRSQMRAQWFTADRMVTSYQALFTRILREAEARTYAV